MVHSGSASRLKNRHRSEPEQSSDNKSPKKTLGSISKQFAFGPMIVLLMFSTAMLILPLGTYFVIRQYIVRSTTIAAMGAIVTVQIILAVYIYKAWSDESKDHDKDQREAKKR